MKGPLVLSYASGEQGLPFMKGPLVFVNRGHVGGVAEMVEVDCRDGGRPTHVSGAPEQTGARAGAHVVSKQVLTVLATNFLNVTRQDRNRTHGSVDRDLPAGLRANSASRC